MHSLKNKTISPLPKVPFGTLSKKVLGRKYEVSIVLVGNVLMRALNKKYRKKNTPTNVLAFPLSKKEGEIFLNLPYIRHEAQKIDRSYQAHTTYLFIHALLHLKGFSHGSTMEGEERRLLASVGIKM